MEIIKYALSHPLRTVTLLYDRYLQNKAFRQFDINAENLIVFVVPEKNRISGGTISIMSLVTITKLMKEVHGAEVVLVTFPGFQSYFCNKYIISKERIFRFSQIKRFANLKKILIHIPEITSHKFYESLSDDDVNFMKNIDIVSINIMNQNIEYMPEPDKLNSLKKLTDRITQTTAHDSYCNQAICNKFAIPTHHFSVFIDLSLYPHCEFKNKENIILLSPDKRDCRESVIKMLRRKLPDYKLVTVKKMPFKEYMLLATKAKFSLTFGEGFDGYLIHAAVVNSLGFAVFNDNFFPNKSFLELDNIYENYDDLFDNISDDIRGFESDAKKYQKVIDDNMNKINELYSYDKFVDNLKRFYQGRFDYYPSLKKE